MIKLNDEIIVTTEKLTSSGEAVARYTEDKLVVFVKNALPDEKLKIKITHVNKRFLKGEITEIIEPSVNRIKPFCRIYNACGSCNFQICSYDYQIKQKNIILKELFQDITDNIYPVIKSPEEINWRHKVQFPTRETKNSKRVKIGYFKENSHDITDIKFCPVQPEIINEITEFLRKNYTLGCYIEKNKKGHLKNILFRISHNSGDILLTFVLNLKEQEFKNETKDYFKKFSDKIKSEFKHIKGVFVNFNFEHTNKIVGNTTLKISGEDFIEEKLNDKTYKIGSVSFFQVNPKSAVNLFNIVKENIKDNSTILDAYGGVGAIGIYVSNKAKSITLVEENKNATACAEENFKINNIKNFEILTGDAKEQFIKFKRENKKFDYVILDPPRSGCDIKDGGLDIISSLTDNIIYVSCNPITLKRDAKYLAENNFKLNSVTGVDLFPHTFHIECVAVFERN